MFASDDIYLFLSFRNMGCLVSNRTIIFFHNFNQVIKKIIQQYFQQLNLFCVEHAKIPKIAFKNTVFSSVITNVPLATTKRILIIILKIMKTNIFLDSQYFVENVTIYAKPEK